MTPEELAKEDPKTLRKYMRMGDQSPLPLGAVKMALMMQDRLKMDAQAQQARAQGNGNPSKPTTIVDRIAEAVKQKIQSEPSPQQMAGIGAVPIPNVMQEQNFAGGGIVAFAKGEGGEELSFADFRNRTENAESKGDPNAIGPMTRYGTAKGKMQVLDMTNRDPGFGVSPARDDSKEERVRVGNDYLKAMTERYKYQPYASLAYNWGPGYVDSWIKRGANPAEIPKESRAYVIQTTGVDLAKMGPGATTTFSKPSSPSSAQKSPTDRDALIKELLAIDEEFKGESKATREDSAAQRALLTKPEAPDIDAGRKKLLAERTEFRRPGEERLDRLTEQLRPDTEKLQQQSERDSRAALWSSLMGARGRSFGAGVAALGGGLSTMREKEAEGRKHADNAQKEFVRAQLLAEKEKFAAANKDFDAAHDYGMESQKAYRTAVSEFTKANIDITTQERQRSRDAAAIAREKRSGIIGALRDMTGQERTDAMIRAAEIRSGANPDKTLQTKAAATRQSILSDPEKVRAYERMVVKQSPDLKSNPAAVRAKALELIDSEIERMFSGSSAPAAATPAPAASTPGRMKVDALGNPI